MWQKAGLPERGPKTWDEWDQDFAPKLKAQGITPLVIPDGANYMDWYFQGMIWSMGGAYSKDLQVTLADPVGIKAGQFLQKQFQDGYFTAAKDATVPFSTGQAAAMLQSTGSLLGVEKDGKFAVGTAFLPSPEGVSGVSTGGAGLAVPAKSKHQQAAAKFLAFLTNTENTVKFSQATGYMPVRTSATTSEAVKTYIGQHPNFQTALDQLPLTRAQDAARAYVAGGGIKIGAALDKIAQGADVASTFTALQETLQKQIDTPTRLYQNPVNTFVAGFIGSPAITLFRLPVSGEGEITLGGFRHGLPREILTQVDKEIIVGVRPESWRCVGPEAGALAVRTTIVEQLGGQAFLYGKPEGVQCSPSRVAVLLSPELYRGPLPQIGQVVHVVPALEDLYFFHPETELALKRP